MRLIEYPSYARQKAKRLFLVSGIAILVACGFVAISSIFDQAAKLCAYLTGFLIFAFAIKTLYGALSSQLGQTGEDRTAKALAGLSDEFCLLRNLQLSEKQGDIDFILLGPFGALVIEQKAITIPIRCQGDKWSIRVSPSYWKPIKSYSHQLKRNLKAVERKIKAPCFGVIVFNDGVDLRTMDLTATILRRRELMKYVHELPNMSCKVEAMLNSLCAAKLPLAG